jgi:hypothetical protein
MTEHTQETVTMKGKCVRCKKVKVLTTQQILDAEQTGAAISTCCFMPMTIESVSFKPVKKKKQQ